MGGNAGIRGYILQTIICMLDTLEKDSDWVSVTMEPTEESEKVDIRWEYPGDIVKVTQVKSSENSIGLTAAKNWCKELKSNSPSASEWELFLVGPLAGNMVKKDIVEGVKISSIGSLDTKILIDLASTKIDFYYHKKNKKNISPQVRELIVNALCSSFGTSSITGEEIKREQFDKLLLSWIGVIEKQINSNVFALLSPPVESEKVPISHRMTKRILELIGWSNFSENKSIEIFNEHTNETDVHSINFVGEFENKLLEETGDYVMVSALHDYSYPATSKVEISKNINSVDLIFKQLKKDNKVPLKRFNVTHYHSLLFWLTTDNNDLSRDFIHHAKENYKRNILDGDVTYYLIDNIRANFLISSIVTAKNYREDVPVKFLYPITEANQSPKRIGQRGLKLPVEYINSSVIPITKETGSKISFLLFCSDPFSPQSLKKLIWLTIRLTSGFGNEYLLYFPDYDVKLNKEEAMEIIRSFDDDVLDEKIKVLKYDQIEVEQLDSLPDNTGSTFKNEKYIENNEDSLLNSKHLNEAFINILPYGDILKPFLSTEAITANDMRIFLAKKGIFVKNADKVKLINLMTRILLSPYELEDFKALIDVKEKTSNSTSEHYKINKNDNLENVFKKSLLNFDNITDNLNVKIVNSQMNFIPIDDKKEEYVLSLITETKDPTNALLVNTSWGKVEVLVKKDNDNFVIVTDNTITRDDKIIVNRIKKIVHLEFKEIDFVEEEKIKVMFNAFDSNIDRVNFLLSFVDVSNSTIFSDSEIISITFKFDDETAIPEKFKDKADKDLIINFDGKKLDTLSELTVPEAKGSILLEEIKIRYKFDLLSIKNGNYYVTYNFSKALRNKVENNGEFNSCANIHKTPAVKRILNIKGLEKDLSKEIEDLKLDKFKKFHIVK